MNEKYYNTIEEKPLPEGIPKPPDGWVHVGNNTDIPGTFPSVLGAWLKWEPEKRWDIDEPHYVPQSSGAPHCLPSDSPYLKRNASPWITDRLPTLDDTDDGNDEWGFVVAPLDCRLGWRNQQWSTVRIGEPWAPYPKMPPYDPPKPEKKPETLEELKGRLERIISVMSREELMAELEKRGAVIEKEDKA